MVLIWCEWHSKYDKDVSDGCWERERGWCEIKMKKCG